MRKNQHHYINALVLACALALGFGYVQDLNTQRELKEQEIRVQDDLRNMMREKRQQELSVKLGELQAEAVYVVDMKNDEVLFGRQETTLYPLASLAKMVTSLVALDNFPVDTVTITAESLAQSGDKGLVLGETWDVAELMKFMLMTSSNDAAHALAVSLGEDTRNFIFLMNRYVQNRGLDDMYFLSPTGLDDDVYGVTGYGTARSIYEVMKISYQEYPDIFRVTAAPQGYFTSQSGTVHRGVNTNTVIGTIPGVVFSKTGYTNDAGGSLAFIFEAGPHHPIGVVILGSTFYGRFDDAQKIVSAILYEKDIPCLNCEGNVY
ncbi:MAG: D-alanyl-D-alanine carboxypeptidase [Candidatus Pacebacteria bacterium]|nr:D-alanyl-D-alanine carboxypeptidase [Candidatus Paceibacterota bacterium]